jgi:hypothetical protein
VPEVKLRLAAALALAGAFTPSVARAAKPDMKTCIAAFDQGQRSRSDNELRRARTELLVCTQESCPAVLRADCAGVLRSLEADVPTVVFATADGDGHDISDAAISAGGETIFKRTVCSSADLAASAAQDRTGAPCTALSEAIRFVGGTAKVGKVRASIQEPSDCPDFQDSCPWQRRALRTFR